MGNFLTICYTARKKTPQPMEISEYTPSEQSGKPALNMGIGPIGGHGPLNSIQNDGRRRFGI
jgi:hypothetical protein